MYLGRVIGNLQSTYKAEGLEGVKFLWVQPIFSDGGDAGTPLVACDGTFQAGIDDRVYIVDGREAGFPLPIDTVPSDATIVGIVERIDL